MFRRFGSRVTLIGQSKQILSQQDPDIAIAVQTLLEREGTEFLLNARVLRADRADNATKLPIQIADREKTFRVRSCLSLSVVRPPLVR